MRKLLFGLLVVASGLIVSAQNAKVITVSDSDAQTAKALWKEKIHADDAWDNFNLEVATRYATDSGKKTGYYKSGWENGIIFSPDFKSIVPKEQPYRFECGNGIILNSPVGSTWTAPIQYELTTK